MKLADKTFGVKVSEELYEKVKMMIEGSGSTSKEWFERAVALTEVQDLRDGSPDYKQDLSELEIHTTRIYELVANMLQRANYIKEDAVRELVEKLDSRELTISDLQVNVKELQGRLSELEEEAKQNTAEKEELDKQLEDQRSVNANNQALIQEYKDKIDTLSSLVNQYKGYAKENADLKEGFAAEKELITTEFEQKENRLLSANEELNASVRDQQDQMEKMQQENETLKAHYENELTRLTEAKDLEKERAVLEVERKYQEKLQQIHDQYNEKISRLYEKFEPKERSNNNQTKKQDSKNKQ